MESANLLRSIQSSLSRLSKSEKKVAQLVLSSPKDIINLPIRELAKQADVSEPTVIRFCRTLGFDGFQAFKLQLAQHLGSTANFSQFSVSPKDSIVDLNKKVFDSTIGSLLNVRDDLDSQILEQAIQALSEADRVEFYGFGASGSVATDAQHKFFRLQVSSASYTDPHIQHMSAITLKPNDVVVAISQSGRTKTLIESLSLARETGATIIGLVPKDTPLAEYCSLPIYINVEDNQHIFTPVASRIAHLLVIDVLAMGVALKRGDLLKDHLKRLNRSLRSLRSNRKKTS